MPDEETSLIQPRRPSVVKIQEEEQIQVPAGFELFVQLMDYAWIWCLLLIDNKTYAFTAAFGVGVFNVFLHYTQYKMGKTLHWPKPLDIIFAGVFGCLSILSWAHLEDPETLLLYLGPAINSGVALGFIVFWLLGRPVVTGYQVDMIGEAKASHPVMVHTASQLSVMFTIAFSSAAVFGAIWPESDWAVLICNVVTGLAMLTAYKIYPAYVKNHVNEIAALYEDEIAEWEAKHPELNFDAELA